MNIKALIKSLMQRRFATVLLVLQLALTLGLVVNSAIMAQDTAQQVSRDLGFAASDLLVTSIIPTGAKLNDEDLYRSVQQQDLDAIAHMPQVDAVTRLNQLPIQNGGWNMDVFRPGHEDAVQDNRQLSYVAIYMATADVFQTLELDLMEGRLFEPSDAQAQDQETPDIIITQSLAEALFGEEPAVGEMTNVGRIVGIVSNFIADPRHPMDEQYVVFWHGGPAYPSIPVHYVIHAKPEHHAAIEQQLEGLLLANHPERDVLETFAMTQRHAEYFQRDTGMVNLFKILCVLMLIVTAISSFAHAQFHVSRQKRQIGIRRALGARRKDVMLYVMTEQWLLIVLGALVGIAIMIALNIGLSTQIDISKPSVLLYLAALTVIFVSGSLATWFPAWRTSLIPPVIATRTV